MVNHKRGNAYTHQESNNNNSKTYHKNKIPKYGSCHMCRRKQSVIGHKYIVKGKKDKELNMFIHSYHEGPT